MKLWGGRFTGNMDPAAWELNSSLSFDQRLGLQDVRGSLAWAKALENAGVLTAEEREQIWSGLQDIHTELQTSTFQFAEGDEDIHTAVERRLGELVGPAAGKLHTGRSRNDQVATDLRLWLLDHLPRLDATLQSLQLALIERAERDIDLLMPGYTHLQRAQAVLLSHWWLSHFWPLERDRQRLKQLGERAAVQPRGSGAPAGPPYPIDRTALAETLGMRLPSPNSLDAVSDRDFVAEFLFFAALTGVHLSRLAEAVALFTTIEFGFFELSDAFATGSSLMPQKKNPDIFELARGKAGALLGALTGLLATLKGLPSAYDKDLQEDKTPLFNAHDTLMAVLPALTGAIRTLTVHADRMLAALEPALMATDLADYFVARGLPFRQAHALAGKAVIFATRQGKQLDQLSLDEFRLLDASLPANLFDAGLYSAFDPANSAARRSAIGGTAPEAVRAQIAQARAALSF